MAKDVRKIATEIVDDVIDYFREELADIKVIYPDVSENEIALIKAWSYTFLKEKVEDEYKVIGEWIRTAYNSIIEGKYDS